MWNRDTFFGLSTSEAQGKLGVAVYFEILYSFIPYLLILDMEQDSSSQLSGAQGLCVYKWEK